MPKIFMTETDDISIYNCMYVYLYIYNCMYVYHLLHVFLFEFIIQMYSSRHIYSQLYQNILCVIFYGNIDVLANK